MPEIDFNLELDFVKGENSEDFFKSQLVSILRQSNSAKNMTESAVLEGLCQDIARSDGPIEVSEKDLEVLEDNFNRLMEDDGNNLPNWLTGNLARLIQEVRE